MPGLLLHFLAVDDGLGLDHPLDAEAGAEGAAAIHDMQVGIVEGVGPRVLELRRAPAGPRQAVVVALARPVAGPQRHQIEVLLVGHVQLEALGRLDRKSTRLNSSHVRISYAVFCLKKKKKTKAHKTLKKKKKKIKQKT